MRRFIAILLLLPMIAAGQRPTTSTPFLGYDANGNITPTQVNGQPLNLPAGTTVDGAAIGASTFGSITGDVSDNAALQAALDTKLSINGGIVYDSAGTPVISGDFGNRRLYATDGQWLIEWDSTFVVTIWDELHVGGDLQLAGVLDTASVITGNTLTANGGFNVGGIPSAIVLSGDQNNWNPSGLSTSSVLLVNGGIADRTITGIVQQTAGRSLTIINAGATNNIILSNENASSTAVNRFKLPGDVTIAPNTSATVWADGTITGRWRLWSRDLTRAALTSANNNFAGANVFSGSAAFEYLSSVSFPHIGDDGAFESTEATALQSLRRNASNTAFETFIAQPADADLTTWAGVTPATGIAAWLADPTSAKLATAVTDEISAGTSPKVLFGDQAVATTSSPSFVAVNGAALNAATPIRLYVSNVTVLTADAPADIATITVPAHITRWITAGTNNAMGTFLISHESGAGTLAGASFHIRNASGGGGIGVAASTAGPAVDSVVQGGGVLTKSTSNTLYVRQTANSANAGTASFYITIYPLP